MFKASTSQIEFQFDMVPKVWIFENKTKEQSQ